MPIWLRSSERKKLICCHLVFEDLEHPGSGFSFPCDPRGRVPLLEWLKLRPPARKNLADCREHPERYRKRVVRQEWTEFIPAVIECDACEARVVLESEWANACPSCGREYNGCGQLLAPRSQWGEESGEPGSF